jgi:carbon monoxide dehydrogenase subunit G
MKIAGEQPLSAPRESVWQLFNDPERLSRLIPGCEKLEVLGPDEYGGQINVGIAAVKGVYSGKLKLEDKRAPEHYKMLVDGKGKQGFVKGSGTLDLVADGPNSTTVRYAGDVQIGGPLMQVGQRMIDSAAKMMLGQFFAAADAELKAHAQGKVASQGIVINFFRYLVRLIQSIFAGSKS